MKIGLGLGLSGTVRRLVGQPGVIGAWTAGAATTLSIADGRARATSDDGTHPRIYREVTGLTPGFRYQVDTNVYVGNLLTPGLFFRVSLTAALLSEDLINQEHAADGPAGGTFTAPANGTVYIGIAAVTTVAGEFCETDETFSLVAI